MLKLLFSPDGTIGSQDFIKGAVVLLAINFFMWLAWYGGVGLGMLAGLISLIFIYCWFCIFAKRLKGAGYSPAWFILIFCVFVLISWMMGGVLIGMLSPELVEMQDELQELRATANPNPEDTLAVLTPVFKGIAIPYAIAYFLTGAAVAFMTNAILARDTKEN